MGLFRGERRSQKRLSVDQVVSTLLQMETNLLVIKDETKGHLNRLEDEKRIVENKISAVTNEQSRAGKIAENLTKLLG